jgi:hypothetical protein
MNKSILLIGNGNSLKDSKLGNKIDEFDEVIRINECQTKGYENDCGTKFTIWSTFNPDKRFKKFINSYKSLDYTIEQIRELTKDIKEIWYVNPNIDKLIPWHNKNLIELGLESIIKRHESPIIARKIKREINHSTTGFILIYLLTSIYDKIYITGFDFAGRFIPITNQHYFGDSPVVTEDVSPHSFDKEMELVLRLEKEDRIIFLKNDTKIEKCKDISTFKEKVCNTCNKTNFLYFWENNICHYCEGYL